MAGAADRRKELEAELEALKAAEAEEDEEHQYEVWKGESGVRASSRSPIGKKIHKWAKAELGIDLDEEPVQDDPEGEPAQEPKAKPGRTQAKGGEVRQFNRRIS